LRSSKLARVTRSQAPWRRTSATIAAAIDGEVCLRSTLSGTGGSSSRTSSKVGTRNRPASGASPGGASGEPDEGGGAANGRLPSRATKPAPMFQRRASARVTSRKARATPAIRAPSGSCETTMTPSRVMWTSISSATAPSSSARWNAGMVFSGSSAVAPRWA
jgi:hypothetical protein